MDEQRERQVVETVRAITAKLVPFGSIPHEEAEVARAGDTSYMLPRSDKEELRELVSFLLHTPGWTACFTSVSFRCDAVVSDHPMSPVCGAQNAR